MRRLLILALLLIAPSAWSLPALVSNVSCGALNACTTAGINTTGANFLVATVTETISGTVTTPTDSKSNTWTALTQHTNSTTNQRLFYSFTGNVGTSHTFTVTDNTHALGLTVMAFSGVGSFDLQNGNANTGSSLATGSLTASANKALIITACGSDAATGANETVNSGFSTAVGVQGSGSSRSAWMAYQVKDPAGALNPTWSDAQATRMANTIASFLQQSGNCAACDMSGKLEDPPR